MKHDFMKSMILRFITFSATAALITFYADKAFCLTPSAPISLNGQNGTVIQGLLITSTTGDGIQLTNCINITIQDCEIGPVGGNAIAISGGSNINIYDCYIHPETLATGCCDTNDGIFATGTSGLFIQGNVIAYGQSNIEVQGSNTITAMGNFLLNPRGPYPRGQNFQSWSTCSDIVFQNNYCLSSLDTTKYLYPEDQEDSVNFGYTTGILAQNNYITGGHSPSGTGMIADEAANDVQFLNNVLVDTGQCGIGIASGTNQIVSGNNILNRTPVTGGGNTGLYVWSQYTDACGPVTISANTVYQLTTSGTVSDYWNGGGCAPVTLINNNWLSTEPTPISPPLIPPQPKNCTVCSPYTTQNSLPLCCPPTPTLQPQSADTGGKQGINNFKIWPNPYNSSMGNINLSYTLLQDTDHVSMEVYSAGFRLINEITLSGSDSSGSKSRVLNNSNFSNLADGYYFLVISADQSGKKVKSQPAVLIIIK